MTEDKASPSPVPVKPVVTGTWQEMVARWLFDQSVSTVLLVLILTATVYGIPKVVLPSIHEGYKSNADSLEKVMKMVVDSSEKQQKMVMDSHDRDRASFTEVIKHYQSHKAGFIDCGGEVIP